VQTKDRQNWQTRYVVQQPFAGSIQQCREKAAAYSCEAQCSLASNGVWPPDVARNRQAQCLQSCQSSNAAAVEQARRYYEIALPERQQREAQTLSRYTGWSLAESLRYAGVDTGLPGQQPTPLWWQKLFGNGNAGARP